jgi:2-phospho-L-lactate/phosphoenolpyruvate guanylyltransferase
MDLRVIIPVKPFAQAKQRLSPALNAIQRAQLAERMFRHVLRVSAAVFNAGNLLVVSRSSDVLAIAQAHGAPGLLEEGPCELNSALSHAARVVRANGNSGVLVLASDLPLLEEHDLMEMTRTECAIAPDRHRRGTNALLWPSTLPFAFGENSFARHLASTRAAGFDPQIVSSPGLAHDIDVPEDLIGAPL